MKQNKNKKKFAYTVYTDGGCAVNPGGPGAYAAVIINQETGEETELSIGFFSTTNNRMEMMAVIAALEHLQDVNGSIELYSDSQYVINTMNGAYAKRKNTDLWARLDKAAKGKDISYFWVRGHNGNEYNERCDEMCGIAMQRPEQEDKGYREAKARGREFYGQLERDHPEAKGKESNGFSIPEGFQDRKIEHMRPKEYCEKYHVHISCAKCIQVFSMEYKHSFKSYVKLKTGGIDSWSNTQNRDMIKGKTQ